MARLILCDAYSLSRESLSLLVQTWDGIDIVEVVPTTDRVRDALSTHRPDVALVVSHAEADSGAVSMLNEIRRLCPGSGLVLLVNRPSPVMLVAAWDAGVSYVVDMTRGAEDLFDAVRSAAAGGRGMSSMEVDEARVRLDAVGMGHWRSLDPTARTILEGVALGMPDQEIAEHIGLSVQTVRNRVSRLLDDFAMTNRTQLAVAFIKAGESEIAEHGLFGMTLGPLNMSSDHAPLDDVDDPPR